MPDWKKIKAEYISGNISLRKIAEKYGVSPSTLFQVSAREKWADLKKQTQSKIEARYQESVVDDAVKSKENFNSAVDKLLKKAIDNMDVWVVDTSTMQQFTNALQKIESMKHIDKSDLDKLEQQARIRKLQKEAEDDGNKEQEIRVILSDGLEDYAN